MAELGVLAALSDARLVVVDVEGNGHQPPEIVELAAVVVQGGNVEGPRSWLVRPLQPITPLVRRIHGIGNTEVADAPPLTAVAGEIEAVLGEGWLVAHNARVEHDILCRQLPGWTPTGVIDTLRLARAVWPDRPSYSLDALIEQEQLDLQAVADSSRRHRAGYDAYATTLLLANLVASLDSPEDPLGQLLELGQRPPAQGEPQQATLFD